MNNIAVNYEMIPICDIYIADRIRQDDGDIDSLADDIQNNGLINPITVMKREEGGYLLIAGVRRLKALKRLGESEVPATVMSPMEASEALVLEISENEKRKDFTPSERLAYAELLKESESQKALQRKLAGKAIDDLQDNRPEGSGKGQTRDIVARKVGFGSSTQMRRAQEISEKRPDLMRTIDKGERTIYGAYAQMKAVMEINKSRGDTQLCSEGYERQIRGYKENLQACQREILRLRGMVKDYRSKCQ